MEPKASPSKAETPWHSAYPAPRNSNPRAISRDELRKWLDEGPIPGKDFLLVDLRRADHEGGTIRGSINLPAQTLYPSIRTLYTLFTAAGVKKVIFYCGVYTIMKREQAHQRSTNSASVQGSSRGRGTRAAGWFDDYLREQGSEQIGSYILFEGITGWASAGDEYTRLMDEYQKEHWRK